MMRYPIIWINFIIMLFAFAVNGQNSNNSGADLQDGQVFFSARYVDCMKNKLPCACEQADGGYFALLVRKSDQAFSIQAMYGSANEPEYWDVERSDTGYTVYRDAEDKTSALGTVEFNNGVLFFREKLDEVSSFSNMGTYMGSDVFWYAAANGKLLNIALQKRGYESLPVVPASTVSGCFCNWELGSINLVYTDSRDKAWILEQKGEKLSIYKYRNYGANKVVPVVIDKVLEKRIDW